MTDDPPSSSSDEKSSKDANPFVAFRRFADAQAGALLKSVSSAFSSNRHPADKPASPSLSDYIFGSGTKQASTEATSSPTQIYSLSELVRRQLLDTFSTQHKVLDLSALGMGEPFTVDYLLWSPHSPLRLEKELPQHRWKEAFLDLCWTMEHEIPQLEERRVENASESENLKESMMGYRGEGFSRLLRHAREHDEELDRGVQALFRMWQHMESPTLDQGKSAPRDAASGARDDQGGIMAEVLGFIREIKDKELASHEKQPEQGDQRRGIAGGPATELDLYDALFDAERGVLNTAFSTAPSATFTATSAGWPDSDSTEGLQQFASDAFESVWDAMFPKAASSADSSSPGSSRPSITSTLMTTERTVGPDGVVRSKLVLKKRFADGQEETHEAMHSSDGVYAVNSCNSSPSLAPPMTSQVQGKSTLPAIEPLMQSPMPKAPTMEKATRSEPKKPGWFWRG
ncbi:MAG: hypothetical protein M1826_001376 [Phylliscum demangeonii]|nr:MAG: hypothetical protein M1826_001376 [Phylliscum demangeonii]